MHDQPWVTDDGICINVINPFVHIFLVSRTNKENIDLINKYSVSNMSIISFTVYEMGHTYVLMLSFTTLHKKKSIFVHTMSLSDLMFKILIITDFPSNEVCNNLYTFNFI